MNYKKIVKEIILVFLVLIILIGVYFLALTFSSLIPSKAMEENVRKTSEIYLKEGERKTIDLKYKNEIVFTFTDALMVNTAYSIDSKKPIESFLTARKDFIPNQTLTIHQDAKNDMETISAYKDEKTGYLYNTKELYGLLHEDGNTDSFEYARYWHGYLVFLRPLLTLFSISEIRIIYLIITLILIAVFLFFMYRKVNLVSAISFFIGLLSVNVLIATQSISDIYVFWIALLGGTYLLLNYEKLKRPWILFMIIGSLTSFLDLLTAPLITIGYMITVYMLLEMKNNKNNLKQEMKKYIGLCFMWLLGYAVTWMSKWIIMDIALGRNIFANAINQINIRANGITIQNSIKLIFERNFQSLTIIPLVYIIINTIGLIINNFVRKRRYNKDNSLYIIFFLLNSLMPIVWYVMIKNHSFIHFFFTYRILSISIINIINIIVILTGNFQTKKDKEANKI